MVTQRREKLTKWTSLQTEMFCRQRTRKPGPISARGNVWSIEFLVEQGADPEFWNHRNVSGWTPMLIAEGHRPGSFKPSPETIAAVEMAMKKGRVISSKED